MAKIWPAYESGRSINGDPWADLPLSEAIALFELQKDDPVSDLGETPRFDVNRDFEYAGFRHIFVEIESKEARKAGWKPGFFRSKISPKEAFGRLIQHALISELGPENVVRVEHELTTDSQGQDAIKVTVVIVPNATQRFANGAVLDALVRLRERLHEMRDDRIPIVDYATETELAQDGGP